MIRLSVCIPTFNRGRFIGETLDCIVSQLPDDTEVVVVDGGSTDETAEVVEDLARRCPAIRYFREPTNSGYDADCDKAVGYAAGDYCWLMSDDDLLVPNAIARVLSILDEGGIDLLVVDAAICAKCSDDGQFARPSSQRLNTPV